MLFDWNEMKILIFNYIDDFKEEHRILLIKEIDSVEKYEMEDSEKIYKMGKTLLYCYNSNNRAPFKIWKEKRIKEINEGREYLGEDYDKECRRQESRIREKYSVFKQENSHSM